MQPVTPVLPSNPSAKPVTFAKDQPEYISLPALRSDDVEGRVTTRWKLSWRERLTLLLNGSVYLQLLTFHRPLQPSWMLEDCGL